MLYRELPYYHVFMLRKTQKSNVVSLPANYEIVRYQEGDETAWCEIQIACGHVDSEEEGNRAFQKAFSSHMEECLKRLYFVRHKDGEYVATIALWFEDIQGRRYERLHWLGVKDAHSGQGIAKALVSKICEVSQDNMYLSSQSWSFPAIHIYEQFGFEPWNPNENSEFTEAWELIRSLFNDFK